MEAGDFQVLCDAVLSAKGYEKRSSSGRKLGSRKTTKGTPDTYYFKNGQFVLCEYTTQSSRLYEKVLDDVNKCLDEEKTGIPSDEICEILVFSSAADLKTTELRDISQQIESQGIHFEFYSPSALADTIYHNYQWLAKDTWGIIVGSIEITDYDGFLGYYDSDAVGPGLSNEYINRQEEAALEELLAAKNVIVVTGAAGVGKTKLVLEVAKKYALVNDYQFWCVRSCQAITYEDVLRAIYHSENSLMFFDDVNKVGGFANILKLAAEKNVKLIVTARSYFLEDIQGVLRESLDYGYHVRNVDIITIPPLSDSDIEKLSNESFGITNPIYLRQIKNIAAGNPRLAVMACETAVSENGLEEIQDASSLYDHYYSGVMSDCFSDERLLIIAGITALMSPFDLKDKEIVQTLLTSTGIDKEELMIHVAKLHDLEIINLEKKRAVAFADQSLQTYLVKKVFLDKKSITLSVAMIHGYEKRPGAVANAIKSLMQVFQSNEMYELIKKEVIVAWDFFEQNDNPCFITFRETFSIFNPEKALLSVKREIDSMGEEEFDASELNFDDAMKSLVSNKCLTILDNFGLGEYTETAFDMLLSFYVKRPEDGLQVYRAIVESFCFDPDILSHTYARELLVVKKLVAFIQGNPTLNNEVLFIEVARYLLKTEITMSRSGRGNVIEMLHGSLPANVESMEYRSAIWCELSQLYSKEHHRKRIDYIVLKYGSDYGRFGGDGQTHFESDLLQISNFINNNYSPENAKNVFTVHHILEDMERIGVPVPDNMLEDYRSSKHFSAIQVLKKPAWIAGGTYEEHEEKHNQKIEVYAKTVDQGMLFDLVLVCRIAESLDIDAWETSASLIKILDYLKSNRSDLFLYACELIRDNNLYLSGSHGFLSRGLIGVLGTKETYDFLSVISGTHKDIWLFEYFCNIPEDSINDDVMENLYCHFGNLGLLEKTPYLDILELKRYKKLDPTILKNIGSILLERYRENSFMLGIYFKLAFHNHNCPPDIVLTEFQGVESILKDAYFIICNQADSFDYKGMFLQAMVRNDVCTISETLSRLTYESYSFLKLNDNNLSFIWTEDNYFAYADEAFDWLCENRNKFYRYEDGLFSSIPKDREMEFD